MLRVIVVLLSALSLVASLLSPAAAMATPAIVRAADLTQFAAGDIISDSVFFDDSTMTEAQIQDFLETKVPACRSGYTCLKDWYDVSRPVAADAMCGSYSGGTRERASRIIYRVARACGINPQVILVTLQKEQGLVTHDWPSEWRYTIAMGQGCPDTAACDERYYGFFNQVYGAAWQFKRYANPAGTSRYFTWYAPGSTWSIRYNPDSSCGSSPVHVANQATANLYYYTPYQPNSAALRAGYGSGDGCSAYGNRNFFNYFTDWFGSTQRRQPCAAPTGTKPASWIWVTTADTTGRATPDSECDAGAVRVSAGTVAQAIATSADGQWRRLRTLEGDLWVARTDVSSASDEQAPCVAPTGTAPATWTWVTTEKVTARVAPSSECAWGAVDLPQDTVAIATRTSADGRWRLLEIEGRSLWVPRGQLRPAAEADLACLLPGDTGPASWVYSIVADTVGRAAPDSACGTGAVDLEAGSVARATRTSADGAWRLLQTEAGDVWVDRGSLRKATESESACAAPTGLGAASWTYVLTADTTGRAAPDSACFIDSVALPAGAVATATATTADGAWRRLSTSVGDLWVAREAIAKASVSQIACPTPIATGPASWTYVVDVDTSGRAVPAETCASGASALPRGTIATAVGTTQDGMWRRLRMTQGDLWVPRADLRVASGDERACAVPASTAPASWTYITREAVTGRIAPDEKCGIGAIELEVGTVARALETSADGMWRRLATDGGDVWVPRAEISHVSAKTTAAVNLRTGPSLGSGVITTLPRGTAVRLLDRAGAWWEVTTATRRGWVHENYVR